jgi:hypothetical protein
MTEERDKEAIGKLLDIISQQSSMLKLSGDDKTMEDAVEIKREWFKQVYSGIEKTNQSIEKAQEAISDLQADLHQHEQESFKKLMEVKDVLNSEIKDVRQTYIKDLDKLSDKFDRSLQRLTEKLENLPVELSKIREDLKKDLTALRVEVNDSIEKIKTNAKTFETDLKKDELKPLNDKVTNIYIKVAVLSSVAGILGSIAVSVILAYMKN